VEGNAGSLDARYSDGPDARARDLVAILTLTRDQELWGMALWVEKTHGDAGAEFIAAKIEDLTRSGEHGGVQLWRAVDRRFRELGARTAES
jgi:hypothetical protein